MHVEANWRTFIHISLRTRIKGMKSSISKSCPDLIS
jgi:hypothetical protein